MPTIEQIRQEIEQIDAIIIEKLADRQALSKQIGQLKLAAGRDIVDLSQEKKLFECYDALSDHYKLQRAFVHQLFEIIIAYSRMVQTV